MNMMGKLVKQRHIINNILAGAFEVYILFSYTFWKSYEIDLFAIPGLWI